MFPYARARTRVSLLIPLLGLLLLPYAAAPAAAAPRKGDATLHFLKGANREQRRALRKLFSLDPDAATPTVDVLIRLRGGARRKSDLQRSHGRMRFHSETEARGHEDRIVTATLPMDLLDELENDPDVAAIEPSVFLEPMMDVVKTSWTYGSYTMGVMQSTREVNGVDGTGVVVGIVDTGIDWSHKDFYVDGTHASRIQYIWDQTDAVGPNPSGYAYGSEWTKANIDAALTSGYYPPNGVREADTNGHGTHVSGTIAGDGTDTNGNEPAGTYTGMAPGADIIMVKSNLGSSQVADGVNYIVARARSLGKRCVINLSLGGQYGPHDGTGALDMAVASVGASTPVVVAMGNDHNKNTHALLNFSATASTTVTVSLSAGASFDYYQFWHPNGDAYSIEVSLTGVPGSIIATAGTNTTSTLGSTSIAIYNATNSGHPVNDKSIIVQLSQNPSITPTGATFVFTRTASGATGRVDGFSTNTSSFTSHRDYVMDIAEPATANNVIAVGAYRTKRCWRAQDGATYCYNGYTASDLGLMADFSSVGPTRDGRMKPLISAPGYGLVASLSTTTYTASNTWVSYDRRHRDMQGTSMATPVVVGAVALVLQANPAITVAEIKTLLQGTARADAAVGSAPNNVWGYGKLLGTPPPNGLPTMDGAATTAGLTNINWYWLANVTNHTYSRVRRASDDADLSGTLGYTIGSWNQTGLTQNTQYSVYVQHANTAQTRAAAPLTKWTLAAAPTSSAPSGITDHAVTCNWGVSGNPGGTEYYLEAATDAGFTTDLVNSGWVTGNSATFTGLLAAHLYYFRITGRNGAGVPTSTVNLPTANTIGTYTAPPTAITYTSVSDNAATLTWSLENLAETPLMVLSRAADFATTVSSGTGAVGQQTVTYNSLSPNATYYFKVKVSTASDENFSAVYTTVTRALPPASAGSVALGISSVAASWSDNGNPAGTEYYAERATDAGFTANLGNSGWTTALSCDFIGLSANVPYYLRVRARNAARTATAPTSLPTRATLAYPPSSAEPSGVGPNGASANWLANGNPGGTQYNAESALDPGFNTGLANTGWLAALTGAFGSLIPNTPYYFRVKARNADSVESEGTLLPSTVTLAAVPLAGATVIDESSVTVNWSANGNPAGTEYYAELATDQAFTENLYDSDPQPDLFCAFDGLPPNTTFYFRVRARNSAGSITAPADLPLGVTPVQPPAPLTPWVFITSVTASWDPLDNPPGTEFFAECASDAEFTQDLQNSGIITSDNYTFEGLDPDRQYFFRVGGRNWSGRTFEGVELPSVYTLPNQPTPLPLDGVTESEVVAHWGTAGNAPTTEYLAETLSGVGAFASSGWVAAPSFHFTGLVPNSTQYFQVRVRNTAALEGEPVVLGSTVTLALAPLAQAPDVFATSMTVRWGDNGNAAGTEYFAERATDAGFTTGLADSGWVAALSQDFAGLAPNATYYLRVRARNAARSPTAVVDLPRALTRAQDPTPLALSGIGTTAITANWGGGANPAGTEYLAERALDAGFGDGLSDSGWTTATSFAFGTLSVNTTYHFRVRSRNSERTSGDPVSLAAVSTLANAPDSAAPSVYGTSTTVRWGANGNPDGTEYYAERATDLGYTAGLGNSGWTTALTFDFTGLTPNTLYHLRVRSRSRSGTAGTPTDLSDILSASQPPAPGAPSAIGAAAVTANWSDNGNPGGTEYYAERSLDAGFTTGLANSGWTTSTNHPFAGLSVNTPYYFRVRSRNSALLEMGPIALPGTSTLANPPVSAAPSGITGDAIVANWTPNGNPSDTEYYVERARDAGFTTDHQNSGWVAANSYAFTGLQQNTQYFFQVTGRSKSGTTTAAVGLPSATTLDPTTPPPANIRYSAVGSASAALAWDLAYPAQSPLMVFAADPAFASPLSSATGSAGQTTTSFSSLTPDTTYFFKVKVSTAEDLCYSGAYSTHTLAVAPLAALPTAVTESSVTANWTGNGNPAWTEYSAERALDAGFVDGLMSYGWFVASSQKFSGLLPNTAYYFRVRARNVSRTSTAPTALASTVTFANPPVSSEPSSVSSFSVSALWGNNGNPAGTEYYAERALDSGFTTDLGASGWTSALGADLGGLACSTTYYFRVRARNSGGTPTAYTALPWKLTLPADTRPPSNIAFSGLTTTALTAGWTLENSNQTPLLALSAVSDFSTTVSSALGSVGQSAATYLTLSPNTTYWFKLKVSTASDAFYSPVVSTITLAGVPASAAPSGVSANAVTANWLANGNPAGTEYYAEAASDAGFTSGVTGSGWTSALGYAFSGFTPNSARYFRVRARNASKASTATTALPGVTTLPDVPGSASPVSVASMSVVVAWTANANPGGTEYLAERATNPGFTTGLADSGWTTALLWSFSGLTPNTLYYFRVRARNAAAAESAVVSLPSATTMPPESPAPTSIAFSGIGPTSLTASWVLESLNESPLMALSVNSSFFPTVSSGTGGVGQQSVSYASLAPNTTYFFKVKVSTAADYYYSATYSTMTQAQVPLSAAPSGVTSSVVAANWTANGNPLSTLFYAERATDPAFTTGLGNSGWTSAYTCSFGTLSPDTTYYFRARARNFAGTPTSWTVLPTTQTRVNEPVADAATGVASDSITVNWQTNGNPEWTRYYAERATNAGFTTGLGNSGWVAASSFTFGGLAANTPHYFRVRARNGAGTESIVVPMNTVVTLTFSPLSAASVVASPSAVTANWLANGNPGGTSYLAEASLDAGFTSVVADSGWVAALTADFSSLSPDTLYYLRVRSRNSVSVAGPATALPSARTLAFAPSPASPSGVGAYAFTANWGANGNPAATQYYAERALDAGFTTGVAASGWVSATSFPFTGLAAATGYFVRVKARNGAAVETAYTALPSVTTLPPYTPPPGGIGFTAVGSNSLTLSWTLGSLDEAPLMVLSTDPSFATTVSSGAGSAGQETVAYGALTSNTPYYFKVKITTAADVYYSAVYSTVTLARAPASAAVTSVAVSSLTANWSANGNPAGTEYFVERSIDAGFINGLDSSEWTTQTSATFTALQPNTLYYLRVRARSSLLVETAPTSLPTAATLSQLPSAYAPGPASSASVSVSWDAAGNPSGTQYYAERATNAGFGAGLGNSGWVASSPYVFTGLSANTTYYFRVHSRNSALVEGDLVALGTLPTLSAAPASVRLAGVSPSSVTVLWTALPAAPPSATCEGYVLKVSPNSDFGSTVYSSSTRSPLVASLSVVGLTPDTDYFVRLDALNWDGSANTTSLGRVHTFLAYESTVPVGGGDTHLVVTPPTPQISTVQIDVPSGAFPSGTKITVNSTPVTALPAANCNQAVLRSIGSDGIELSAEGLQPSKPVTVTMTFDPSALPSGSDPRSIVIARWVPESGQWTMLPTKVDLEARTAAAETSHFSRFAPFVTQAAGALSSVQIFPLPWEQNTGGSFDAPKITFSNLPSETTVRIFTILGEFVWSGSASPGGVASWNGTTRGGFRVASGTYLAVIEGGGSKVVRRLVVIR
ncbi:MAG: fibronectin type III domain-containing protein [Elusimicrobiota bacterium]|jgi:hypothetical protein